MTTKEIKKIEDRIIARLPALPVGPNEHIYIGDTQTPIISLVSRTLSDGSHVWDLVLREAEIGLIDEKRARMAIASIGEALKRVSVGDVLHL